MPTSQYPLPSGFSRATTAAEALGHADLTGRLAVVTGGYAGLGLEFAGPAEPPVANPIKRAAGWRRRAEKGGLDVVSYCVGAELLVPAAEQRKAVDALKVHVDVAAELGVPSMRHDVTRGFGDYSKGVRIPKTFDAAVKALHSGQQSPKQESRT